MNKVYFELRARMRIWQIKFHVYYVLPDLNCISRFPGTECASLCGRELARSKRASLHAFKRRNAWSACKRSTAVIAVHIALLSIHKLTERRVVVQYVLVA